jgi:hypothetical protein
MVSVRTRLESPALLFPDGGANAVPAAEADGNPEPRDDEDGVLNSTGSSSRGMTRSVVSPTRSLMDFPVGPSAADTTLVGVVSAVITGGTRLELGAL